MKRFALSIVIQFCLFSNIFCQIRIKVVEKGTRTPIESAYAVVLSKDSSPVCYGYTDENGNCELDIDTNSISPDHTLNVSCLGYARQLLPLNISNGFIQVELEEGAFHIKEIRVSSERIKLEGDTIEYSVRGFSNPRDRSIADVLSKMPGIEVKSNGSIYFNGKPINKFYIEDMDLMGNKYRLASENIDFRKVKSVQVLQNHQKIAALRGKSFSENAAINLVLEEEAKSIPIGQGEAGIGCSGSTYDRILATARLMYMIFSKQHQNLSIVKCGNNGKDLYTEIQPLPMDEEELSATSSGNYVNSASVASLDIGDEKQNFGRSALAATNNLKKLKDHTFFRTQIGYYYDKTQRENETEIQYLLSDGTRTDVVESIGKTSRKNRIDLSLCYEQNEERHYIMDKLSGTLLLEKSYGSFVNRSKSGSLYARPDNRYLYNQFKLTRPTEKVGILSVSSDVAYDGKPQELLLINGKTEKLSSDRLAMANKAELLKKYKDITVTHRIGWNVNRNTVESYLDGIENICHQHLTSSDLYYRGNVSYQNRKTVFSGAVSTHWINRSSKASEPVFSDGRVTVDGFLSFRYTISPMSNLTLYYNVENKPQELAYEPQGVLYSDYRTAISSELYGKPDSRHTIGARIHYSNPIKGTFLSFGLSGYKGTNSTIGEFSYNDGIYYSVNHYYPTDMRGMSASARFNQALPFWKSVLSADGSYSYAKGNQLIQGDIAGYTTNRSHLSFSWSGRPFVWLSIEGEYRLSMSSIRSVGTTRINKSDYNLTISGIFSKDFDISASTQYATLGKDNKDVFLSDVSARYKFKKVNLELIVNNITNLDRYVKEEISNLMESRTVYRLRPREVLLKLSWVM